MLFGNQYNGINYAKKYRINSIYNNYPYEAKASKIYFNIFEPGSFIFSTFDYIDF